jgi:hypothetical protein
MIATLLLATSAAFPHSSVTPAEFQSGAFDDRRVQMAATVVDSFDERRYVLRPQFVQLGNEILSPEE